MTEKSKSQMKHYLDLVYHVAREPVIWGTLFLFLALHVVTLGNLIEAGYVTVPDSTLTAMDRGFQALAYILIAMFGLYIVREILIPLYKVVR